MGSSHEKTNSETGDWMEITKRKGLRTHWAQCCVMGLLVWLSLDLISLWILFLREEEKWKKTQMTQGEGQFDRQRGGKWRREKRDGDREREMKAVDSKSEKAMRRSVISLTSIHCNYDLPLLEQNLTYLSLCSGTSRLLLSLFNFPQCSIMLLHRGQRERNSKTWKTNDENFALCASGGVQRGINVERKCSLSQMSREEAHKDVKKSTGNTKRWRSKEGEYKGGEVETRRLSDEETDRDGCRAKRDKDEWTRMEEYWFQRCEGTTAGHGGIEWKQIRRKNGEMY